MKIGILTYHACFNYGACLQAYALQSTIKDMGFDCEIIDYQSDVLRNICDVFSKRPTNIREIIKNVTRLPYKKQLMERQRLFEEFINKKFELSPRCRTEKDVERQADEYDCIICGSDQTWNLDPASRYQNAVYFLNFPKHQKRISYATSFGQWVEKAPLHEDEFLPWVSEYDALSMREQSGVDYLRSKGLQCELVVDPTLLVDRKKYDAICRERLIDESYILLFTWDGAKDATEIAKKIQIETHAKPIYIVAPPRAMFSGIERKLDVGPCEFLSLVKYADYVVTNSFHGTVFSIIYQKRFVSVISGHVDKRRESLMNHLGLKDHLMSLDNFDFGIVDKTEYKDVTDRLAEFKIDSMKYLENALGTGKDD